MMMMMATMVAVVATCGDRGGGNGGGGCHCHGYGHAYGYGHGHGDGGDGNDTRSREKWKSGWARMARNVENQDEVELDENQERCRKIYQKKCSEENIWRKQCPPHGTHAMPRKGGKLCARARLNPHQSAEAHVYSGWDAVGDPHLVHQGESCPWKTCFFFPRLFSACASALWGCTLC